MAHATVGIGERRVEPNPFGYADHRPFTGFGNELAYGEKPDGTLLHVNQAARGKACDCVCPACGKPLMVRRGTIKIEHFAHVGTGAGCGRGAETNAHIWAKEVLEREKRLLLPAVVASYGELERTVHPSRMLTFAEVRLERALGDIVPDVVLTTEKGDKLLVEVHVTHACGDVKIAKLKERRLPTVEVHLRQWRTSQDRKAIEAALLTKAPRNWLYNRKIEDAEAELAKEAAVRTARAARERLRCEQEREQRERREAEKEARRAATATRRALDAARSAAAQRRLYVGEADQPDARESITFSIPSFGFLVPSAAWQQRIYERCIDDHHQFQLTGGTVTPAQVAQALDDLIHPGLTRTLENEVLAGLREAGVRGLPPHEAIDRYLDSLRQEGVLALDAFGTFKLAPEKAGRLEQRRLAEQARDRRQRSLDRSWRTIAKHLEGDIDGAVAVWRARLVRERKLDPDQLVARGGPEWDAFDQALLAIENMITAEAKSVNDLLCLPLETELAKSREREQAAADKARRDRVQLLEARALVTLGPETEGWLASALLDGDTPHTLASQDDAGLSIALERLREAGKAREVRIVAERIADECRGKLKKAALSEMGAERADLFLRSHHPRLGAAPEAYCTDERRLSICLRLLGRPAATAARERRR